MPSPKNPAPKWQVPVCLVILCACLPAISVTGCGTPAGPGSVSGTVTYNGQKVKYGQITLSPEASKGPPVVAPIEAGAYSLPGVSPGKFVANVQAFRENSQRTPEQLLPGNVLGNNKTVEVTSGKQVLNFDLKAPGH